MLGSKSCGKQTLVFFEKNEGLFSSTFLSEHSKCLKLRYDSARLFYAYEKYNFGKSQNIHNSANIGPFLEFEVSMETSVQEDSGF